ncbi:MAG: hypothetical protein AMXMBFR33_02010 [Candidatus Xenobia bacterium]
MCPDCPPNPNLYDEELFPYRNIGREHWCYCERHGTCWCIGENCYSSWHYETPEDWERNRRFLAGFRVQPCRADSPQTRPPLPAPRHPRRSRRRAWRELYRALAE